MTNLPTIDLFSSFRSRVRLVSTSSRSALVFAWTCCPWHLLHPHSFPSILSSPFPLDDPFNLAASTFSTAGPRAAAYGPTARLSRVERGALYA